MAFISYFVLILVLLPGAIAVVVVVAKVPVMISIVDAGTVGGNVVISVEGVVMTVGTTSGG